MEAVAEKGLELNNKSQELTTRANAIVVKDRQGYEAALEFRTVLKSFEKEIEGTFKPIKEKQHAAWKEACNQEKKHLDPVKDALKIVDQKACAWYETEQKRIEEENRKAQEEARKREEEARLAKAEELEKAGHKKAADAVLEAPVLAQAPKQEFKASELAGVTKTYDFEIVDEKAIPREYLTPDTVAIRRTVMALKEKTNIPGIKVVIKTGLRQK